MTLSRKQRRAQIKEGPKYLRKKGLSPDIRDVKLVLLTRRLVKILADKKNLHRASDAAIETQKVLDLSLRNNRPAEALACKKGCSYCCHNFVSATAPQVFRIGRFIKETHKDDLAPALEKIFAAEDETRNVDRSRRFNERQPCAFLLDGVCSVYDQRPTACRGMASIDVSACEKRVDGIPVPPAHNLLKGLVDFGLFAALKACGLSHASYELNHAVRIVLEELDTEQRWLNGEDVFADAMKDTWKDDPFGFSEDFIDALVAAANGKATDILDFQLPKSRTQHLGSRFPSHQGSTVPRPSHNS